MNLRRLFVLWSMRWNAMVSSRSSYTQNDDETGQHQDSPRKGRVRVSFVVQDKDRMDPFSFRFQFKNVEYCSGRNKTLLCYLVDQSSGADGLLRGFLEDEHAGLHAELAFFQLILPQYDPSVNYTVTWYVSSSPCAHCCSKLLEILQERKTLRLNIFSARLLEAEEEEGQEDNRAGMKALAGAGCKLRVMKPLDFSYSWDTFVEHEDERFTPWEDCQENYEYHHEKLAQILE
uniref:Apolipoprotein B mRNA editing enzyme, catalytic polypeptide-like 2a n=1 Tax=Astyanax mexicanus TaxID=7994 RepID=A0A8B9LA34_ASTMX